MSNFPQHQGTLFLGVMNLSIVRQPNTPRKRALLAEGEGDDGFFFFLASVPRLFTTNIPGGFFCFFFVRMWVVLFWQAIFRAAFESHWDLRGRAFSDFLKHEKMTKIHAKNRVRTVTGSFEIVKPTHNILKSRVGNAFPRVSTGRTSFRILRKTKYRQILMV